MADETKNKPLDQADSNWTNVPGEIDFDPDAQVSKLVDLAEAELRDAKAHYQREQADKEREAKEHAEAKERLERAQAFYDKVIAMLAERKGEIDSIQAHYRSAGSEAGVVVPASFMRRRAGALSLVTLPLVVLAVWFLRPQITTNVSASAESNATVIQAETVEGILGENDGMGWSLLTAEHRAAFRAEGIDPYAEEGE